MCASQVTLLLCLAFANAGAAAADQHGRSKHTIPSLLQTYMISQNTQLVHDWPCLSSMYLNRLPLAAVSVCLQMQVQQQQTSMAL